MTERELFDKLLNSIVECDEEGAKKAATEILKVGIDPLKAIEHGLSPTAKILGDRFERGEIFLTNLMLAADVMKAVTSILMSSVTERRKKELEARKIGTVVIATVSGDIHDIGKNLVSTLLSVSGFTVYDLGKDVDSMRIIEKAMEVKADIIALSALMSTTRPAQKEVVNLLKSLGKREDFMVMVGGGSVDELWVEEIAADGWTQTSGEAVRLAQELVARRKR